MGTGTVRRCLVSVSWLWLSTHAQTESPKCIFGALWECVSCVERSDVGRPVIAGLEMSTKTSTGKAPVKKTTYSRFMDDSRCGTLSNAYVLQTSGSSDVESEEEKEDHEATPKSSGRRLLFTDVLAAVNTSKVTTTVSKTLPDWKTLQPQNSHLLQINYLVQAKRVKS